MLSSGNENESVRASQMFPESPVVHAYHVVTVVMTEQFFLSLLCCHSPETCRPDHASLARSAGDDSAGEEAACKEAVAMARQIL